jgi:hypothetical protein
MGGYVSGRSGGFGKRTTDDSARLISAAQTYLNQGQP